MYSWYPRTYNSPTLVKKKPNYSDVWKWSTEESSRIYQLIITKLKLYPNLSPLSAFCNNDQFTSAVEPGITLTDYKSKQTLSNI